MFSRIILPLGTRIHEEPSEAVNRLTWLFYLTFKQSSFLGAFTKSFLHLYGLHKTQALPAKVGSFNVFLKQSKV